MNILVVEDDPMQLRIITRILNKINNIKVTGFDNVSDCLFEMAVLDEPFILMTDIQLPERSGVSLIKELNQNVNLKGLVIISALDIQILESIALLAQKVGVDAVKVLPKPFDINEIERFVISVEDSLLASKGVALNNNSPIFSVEELTLSLLDDEYQPYFQPQVNVESGQVKGLELLGRLYTNKKLYGPGAFIPQLIDSNNITAYTLAILRKGIKLLQAYGLDHLKLSINVDYQSLSEADFAYKVNLLLEELNFPEANLVIEVTETSSDLGVNVTANLAEFRVNDIKISIDDFGMGYSGLNELLSLPFSELKIDKQQIDVIETSPKAYSIVNLLCSLSHSLNLNSVAEGVETIEQVELLKKMGVKTFQGYFFSKPVPIYDLDSAIENIEDMTAKKTKVSLI